MMHNYLDQAYLLIVNPKPKKNDINKDLMFLLRL